MSCRTSNDGDVNVNENDTDNKNKHIVLPYVKKFSEEICMWFNKLDKVIFSVLCKLSNMFIKTDKGIIEKHNRSNVVYRMNCNDCEKCYIGETKRYLQTRKKEHLKKMNSHQSMLSVISEHRMTNHEMDWSGIAILDYEPNYKKRLFSEMAYITKYKNIRLNRQRDLEGWSDTYNCVLPFL